MNFFTRFFVCMYRCGWNPFIMQWVSKKPHESSYELSELADGGLIWVPRKSSVIRCRRISVSVLCSFTVCTATSSFVVKKWILWGCDLCQIVSRFRDIRMWLQGGSTIWQNPENMFGPFAWNESFVFNKVKLVATWKIGIILILLHWWLVNLTWTFSKMCRRVGTYR